MSSEWYKQYDEQRKKDDVEVIITPEEERKIQMILERDFRPRLKHPASAQLPGNPDKGSAEGYEKILAEYSQSRREDVETLNQASPESGKVDFEDVNIGWKFHLNVSIENVVAVSEYLIREGYIHKYLTGGESQYGKVFTVYIGSHALAKKLAQKISQDLKDKLAKPDVGNEVEFETGVVGRFVAKVPGFNNYGTAGF